MQRNDSDVIFERIKKLLLPYAGQMKVRTDQPDSYQLYIKGDFALAGKPFKELYFAGVTIRKTMVALYFFPIYTHPTQFTLPAVISKNLKGKSCFNFKQITEEQENALAALLAAGAAMYAKLQHP
ncbi:MAG TPA: hypothetical protein VL307_12520 [Chitinophagaceae bacterium]|nr:hypothetical protein [Chitinophagaceae bacterium]